jgi:hypothetical protein|tara:strand:+ start:164 stop:382 length:219 start_codon:yes stop_codon:yes gene_type:complete
MIHYLDIQDKYFIDIEKGVKTFEIRRKNKDYKVGDLLVLKNEENNNIIKKTICYISDIKIYNIKDILILGIK